VFKQCSNCGFWTQQGTDHLKRITGYCKKRDADAHRAGLPYPYTSAHFTCEQHIMKAPPVAEKEEPVPVSEETL